MESYVSTVKSDFQHKLDRIICRHRSGGSGTRTALALTERMDTLMKRIYDGVERPGKVHISLVALGGYGRRELCFYSDTDIMFLIQEDHQKKEAGPAVESLLHGLLDCGLDMGHSFRTIQECVELSHADLESWISVLEGRFICGNRRVFSHFRNAIDRQIREYDKRAFVEQLVAATEARQRKYGSAIKLLEPNLKNSVGGLRDLHAVYWLLRGTGKLRLPLRVERSVTALTQCFAASPIRPYVTVRSAHTLRRSLDDVLRFRNELHLQAQAQRDTLEFTAQRNVAEALRYRPDSKRTSVERYMQEYYVAARTIAEFGRRVLNGIASAYEPSPRTHRSKKLDDRYLLRRNKLYLQEGSKKLKNEDVLVAFHHMHEQNAAFSAQLEEAIHRSLSALTPLRTISETSLFRELLNKPSGVSTTVRSMNDLRLLERWIPEWKYLVAFFQHNLYHFYTADEHTLRVLSNAEALQDASSSFGEVYRSLPRRDTLYLACLLHDIAKPKRIGDHEIIGVEIARTILQRLRYSDTIDDVLFLIRHHLLMEQIAFRRNLSDTQTILYFSSRFSRVQQLDLLYILTYADLSAVNKNVWTDWKGMLLYELHKKTRTVLEAQMTHKELKAVESIRQQAAVEDLVSELEEVFSQDEARGHLQSVNNPAYLAAFNPAEVVDHIRRIKQNESVSTVFGHQSDFTEVTFLARDAPFLLSRLCGVLSANDANIFDANIFTRDDGIVIDKFRVSDSVTKSSLSNLQCQKIEDEVKDVLEGRVEIHDLLHRHHVKWKRRARMRNPNTRLDVEFEDHPYFTIIDVYAPDALGFLYKVTEAISRLGLNISFAKIATRVDGIVDSFYVQDMTGSKIETPEQRHVVRTELLKVITEISESELIITPSV